MKRIIGIMAMLVAAGCSTPGTEMNITNTEPKGIEQAVPANKGEQQAEREQRREQPVLVPAEDAIAGGVAPAAPSIMRAKSAHEAFVNQVPMPPSWNRESYNPSIESGFVNTVRDPLSTFSIDVDTASYANVRRFVKSGSLPPAGAVRIEELINAFSYEYPAPEGGDPLALSAEVGPSPFHQGYQLARIGLTAKDVDAKDLPPSNLVFLIDVSGSMQDSNKLPLLQQALPLLVRQLGARDRVAMVVYAGGNQVVLPPTPGNRQETILTAIERLRAGGSTHASGGIRTAYQLARQSFISGGNNRVILASDGDFNVGITSRDELQRLIEEERRSGVYLTVLGFGIGNYHDDTMELLADKGNGNYAYIDSLLEAKKVLVKEMAGTLHTLADDVKIQVEFNPARVGAYRLIGYENRALADEEFRDDRKDAGEVGVGHRVTALYELIPAGHPSIPELDPLKYQTAQSASSWSSNELMTVKLRYKPKGEQRSRMLSVAVADASGRRQSADFRFTAAVAGYGMLLTGSEYLGGFTWEQCLEMLRTSRGSDPEGDKAELYRVVEASQLLAQQRGSAPAPKEEEPSIR